MHRRHRRIVLPISDRWRIWADNSMSINLAAKYVCENPKVTVMLIGGEVNSKAQFTEEDVERPDMATDHCGCVQKLIMLSLYLRMAGMIV